VGSKTGLDAVTKGNTFPAPTGVERCSFSLKPSHGK